MTDSAPQRPALALRIGVTGARRLDPAQLPRLRQQVRAGLTVARDTMRRLARDPLVAAAYQPGRADVRFLSPLALGADRLAAREALALGYRLHVPMPFPQAEYETDFGELEDFAEFRALIRYAGEDCVAIDGDHGPEMNRAYEAVGRYVVRHSDVLIAIWDGGAGAGRGGTADIVRYAAGAGVPVYWLHATQDRPPTWFSEPADGAATADEQLRAWLEALVPPPPAAPRHGHGLVARLAGIGRAPHASPEADYIAEPPPRRWFWQAYARLMRWASGRSLPWTPPRRPDDPVGGFWFDRYGPADAAAAGFAARYRSAYVWVFALSALAIAGGVLSLVFMLSAAGWWLPLLFALGEFGAMAMILLLIVVGIRGDWHEHSIEYRLLAELCRKQQVLAPLGWTLPIVTVRSLMAGEHGADRAGWVAWRFAAEQRAAPLPRGELARAVEAGLLDQLIDEQHAYHVQRLGFAEAAGRRLEQCGVILFVAVLGCVLVKLVLADLLDLGNWALPFGILASVLPGISAACLGIRGYAELPVLADQSRRLAGELEQARERLARLARNAPLASQDIGAEAAAVATLMLQDLEGWARLFRVKTMEPA